jgi:hypothetical protein
MLGKYKKTTNIQQVLEKKLELIRVSIQCSPWISYDITKGDTLKNPHRGCQWLNNHSLENFIFKKKIDTLLV